MRCKSSYQRLILLIASWLVVVALVFSATPAFAVGNDQVFLQKLDEYTPQELLDLFGGIPDSSKVEAAQFACKALKRGVELAELNLLGMKLNHSSVSNQKYIAGLMQAGVETYCPKTEYEYQVAAIRNNTNNL
ncbi:DUF732 domain-containing protein [Chroococcidiopsidales cyanobacterium LEGE 13417]|nr:DUF732 domain-containing protein [Chroococcidiopsidales cyanobacterium LEGE 13417]